MKQKRLCYVLLFLLFWANCMAQVNNNKDSRHYKNVIRYNLSGALLFGADRYVVFGYERVLTPHSSFSINMGGVSFPKLISINTDSLSLQKDQKRSGFNVSADYRFYLVKENKYEAPHGLYIGPYYSYNRFNRETIWKYRGNSATNNIDVNTKFTINTIGLEIGYQLILWKRVAIDLLMVGPGFGLYDYNATFNGNISGETKDELLNGLKQLLTQKFPGMSYVISDNNIDANGRLRTYNIGYRYIIHVGFCF